MFNTSFSIPVDSYAGGYSRNNRFAWQVRGGLNWELSRNWILSSEVRYFGVGTPTLNGPAGRTLEAGYNTVDVMFGLTYRF
jgi:opacity protein-like surface antigen